jgi:putative transposase
MIKAYKYQLYPINEQKQLLIRAFGCARYVYNVALEVNNNVYKSFGYIISCNDLMRDLLRTLKEQYDWLNVTSAQSLQAVINNLYKGYFGFYRGQTARPKYKSKNDNHQSLQFPQNVRIDWKDSKVIVPKIGAISAVLHRKFVGKIKTCTVSKTPTNKFFISILVDDGIELPVLQEVRSETTIGIDVGIKSFLTLSDGYKADNPAFLRKTLKKLAKAQRVLARKQKGSKNRIKARLRLARIYEILSNQRHNFLHQLSNFLIKSENQTFILETLDIKKMMQNRKLAREISDCASFF